MTSLWLVLAGLVLVIIGLMAFRVHAFMAMILSAIIIAALTPTSLLQKYAESQVDLGKMSEAAASSFTSTGAIERVMKAFGDSCGQMGLLIIMASIIGRCLLDSGAAQRIVSSLLNLFGQARVHFSFVFTGFTLAIPVYFDAVFYMLMPIGKAMARTTGKDYLLYILTIVAGATMAHSLVPPTPGPTFTAKELGVPLPMMMLGGALLGLCTASFGLVYAVWVNKRVKIDLPQDDTANDVEIPNEHLPPLYLALSPIIIPLALIAYGGFWGETWITKSDIALTISALISLGLAWGYQPASSHDRREAVQQAIMSGATILVITAAGGAFGSVLRQTDIASLVQTLGSSAAKTWALPMVFMITTLVRTAQGSATVAMITAAPIAKAFIEAGDLGFHPLYLALAVGCGSKPIPWLNDSGFWIITRMTGMRESQTLRLVTPMMSLMGVVGLPLVMLAAWLWPMV